MNCLRAIWSALSKVWNLFWNIIEWAKDPIGKVKRMVREVLTGQILIIMETIFIVLGVAVFFTAFQLLRQYLTYLMHTKSNKELYEAVMIYGVIVLLVFIVKFFYAAFVYIRQMNNGDDPGADENDHRNGDDAEDCGNLGNQGNQDIYVEQLRQIQENYPAQEGDPAEEGDIAQEGENNVNEDNQRQFEQEHNIPEVPQNPDLQLEQGGLPDPIGPEPTRQRTRRRRYSQSKESDRQRTSSDESAKSHKRSRSDEGSPRDSAARGKENRQKHQQDESGVQEEDKEAPKQKGGAQRDQSLFAHPSNVQRTPGRYPLRYRDNKGAVPTSEPRSASRISPSE